MVYIITMRITNLINFTDFLYPLNYYFRLYCTFPLSCSFLKPNKIKGEVKFTESCQL